MSLDFPSAPVANQRYIAEGRTFLWNGSVWILEAESIPWATLDEALAGLATNKVMSPAAMKALIQASEPEPPNFGPLTCRAWARVDGLTGAILAQENVASVGLLGDEGVYTITFTTPLPNDDYIVHANAFFNTTSGFAHGLRTSLNPTTTSFELNTANTGGSGVVGVRRWASYFSVAVFL